jgi:hypothetical protein
LRIKEMIINDILAEVAYFDREFAQREAPKLKVLGAGADKIAFLRPDSKTVTVFVGIGNRSQEVFVKWINYCRKHPDNPFLPRFFSEPKIIPYRNKNYVSVDMEFLKPANSALAKVIDRYSNKIQQATVQQNINPENKIPSIEWYIRDIRQAHPAVYRYITKYVNEGNQHLFFDTIKILSELARKSGYALDLHKDNIMSRADGSIVILDPWYVGNLFSSGIRPKGFPLAPNEVTESARFHKGFVQNFMSDQGYGLLGLGSDKVFFNTDPTSGNVVGYVGFGGSRDRYRTAQGRVHAAQYLFMRWAEFCKKNSNNPFLPKFGKWERVAIKGRWYLRIEMERLTPVDNLVGNFVYNLHPWKSLPDNLKEMMQIDPDMVNSFIKKYGPETVTKLHSTLTQIFELGEHYLYDYDIHPDNVMMRGQQIVITDPWWTAGR